MVWARPGLGTVSCGEAVEILEAGAESQNLGR